MEIVTVKVNKPDDVNIIIGQSHFIKTVEDLYETLVASSVSIKFGVAFCEASGKTLVRSDGNSDELKKLAESQALEIAAGHMFFIALQDAFPINVLSAVKQVSEVCRIFCATANPTEVVVAVSEQGRGILGVIDGFSPKSVESAQDVEERKKFLRTIGYKR